jgi:hypothetical protein
MDTDLFGGSDDSDDVDSDTHIVSVSVSHETLCQLNTVLESIEAPDVIRAPLRREIHQYTSYANYTPTFTSWIAATVMYFGTTGSATMLFSGDSAMSYVNAARHFTIAYLHGLKDAYEQDSTVGREQTESLEQLLEMLNETPAMADALSRMFTPDTDDSGGVFDADTIDADDNPFDDDREDNHIEDTVEDDGTRYRVASEQLDADPEYASVAPEEMDAEYEDDDVDDFIETVEEMMDDIKSNLRDDPGDAESESGTESDDDA